MWKTKHGSRRVTKQKKVSDSEHDLELNLERLANEIRNLFKKHVEQKRNFQKIGMAEVNDVINQDGNHVSK